MLPYLEIILVHVHVVWVSILCDKLFTSLILITLDVEKVNIKKDCKLN